MILTVTLNPSIDYLYTTKTFNLGRTNKMENPSSNIGGKGINAGRAASLMGAEVLLTGILCGDNGEKIDNLLEKENLFEKNFFFLSSEENSRNAITIMHDNGTHTEITEEGPLILPNQESLIYKHILNTININPSIDIVGISGSIHTQNPLFYAELVKVIQEQFPWKKIILDVSGEQLENVLKQTEIHPFMIKPNIHEFNDLTGSDSKTKQDIIKVLKDSDLFKQVSLTLISCGSEGGVVKYNDELFDITIPKIEAVNPTGAGDSTVGGFMYACQNNMSIVDSLKLAMACGISNTKHKNVGEIEKLDVLRLVDQISVKKI